MNQDKITLEAVESTSCSGCFFEETCGYELRYKYFPCTAPHREDGMSKIWVIAKDQGEQDEAKSCQE